MPTFRTPDQEQIAQLNRRVGSGGFVDLTEYMRWIALAQSEADGWGSITLEPRDSTRAIKRRTTIAGKEMSKIIKWHRKSTDSELIFQVIDVETAPARKRRSRGARTEGGAGRG